MGEAVALADHEALEGVAGVEASPARLAARLERREADLRERGAGGLERFADQDRVAALDPGADAVRGGEMEGRPARAEHLQRPQPEVEGRVRDRCPEASLDVLPEGVELLSVGVFLHPRATIAAACRPDSGRVANPEQKFSGASVYCDAE